MTVAKLAELLNSVADDTEIYIDTSLTPIEKVVIERSADGKELVYLLKEDF